MVQGGTAVQNILARMREIISQETLPADLQTSDEFNVANRLRRRCAALNRFDRRQVRSGRAAPDRIDHCCRFFRAGSPKRFVLKNSSY